MSRIRLLIADDHAVLRDGLKLLLNRQPDMEVVGEAGDGEEALKKVRQLNPDVVLMDLSMPNVNGVEATEAIKRSHPHVKVLVLTVHEGDIYLQPALKAGARGYIVKRAAAEEVVDAIHVVVKGGTYIHPSVADQIVQGYVNPQPSAEEDIPLSGRELQVLTMLAQGYSNKEIAEKLFLAVRTVETYKQRLMEKLRLESRAELVRYALGKGLLSDV
jgi:two-component system response regulator NreC